MCNDDAVTREIREGIEAHENRPAVAVRDLLRAVDAEPLTNSDVAELFALAAEDAADADPEAGARAVVDQIGTIAAAMDKVVVPASAFIPPADDGCVAVPLCGC